VKYNKQKGKIMKVVFLQDVPNVAKAGEVKEVASGYARNFLIPKKLALVATPQTLGQTEIVKRVKARENAELATLAQQIEGKEVTLKAKAGAKDRLYGSITSADIATELSKVTGLAIDKRKLELDEPIRQLGSYEVGIRLGKDTVPKIRVSVIEEEAPKKEEKPPKKEEKAAKAEEKAPEKEEKAATAKKKPPTTKKKTAKKEEKTTTVKKKAPTAKKTAKKEEKPPAEEEKS
jgi:large subunit ribosomal protein L9